MRSSLLWAGRLAGGRRGARAVLAAAIAAGALMGAAPARAADPLYDFAAPPSGEANRVYGVNRKTGEMSACQFERPEGSKVGVTRCFVQSEGAGPQKAGNYGLMPTRYAGETGIFRVNHDTGEMSICYVREQAGIGGATDSIILCTPPGR